MNILSLLEILFYFSVKQVKFLKIRKHICSRPKQLSLNRKLLRNLGKFSPWSLQEFIMEASKNIKGKKDGDFSTQKGIELLSRSCSRKLTKPPLPLRKRKPRIHHLFFHTLSLLSSSFPPSSYAEHYMWSVWEDYIVQN